MDCGKNNSVVLTTGYTEMPNSESKLQGQCNFQKVLVHDLAIFISFSFSYKHEFLWEWDTKMHRLFLPLSLLFISIFTAFTFHCLLLPSSFPFLSSNHSWVLLGPQWAGCIRAASASMLMYSQSFRGNSCLFSPHIRPHLIFCLIPLSSNLWSNSAGTDVSVQNSKLASQLTHFRWNLKAYMEDSVSGQSRCPKDLKKL